VESVDTELLSERVKLLAAIEACDLDAAEKAAGRIDALLDLRLRITQ
jgi:hypothetical protein